MYQLTIYRMKTTGRWKWRFSYQQRVLARSDYHYVSPSKAELAFNNFASAVFDKKFRTRVEK